MRNMGKTFTFSSNKRLLISLTATGPSGPSPRYTFPKAPLPRITPSSYCPIFMPDLLSPSINKGKAERKKKNSKNSYEFVRLQALFPQLIDPLEPSYDEGFFG